MARTPWSLGTGATGVQAEASGHLSRINGRINVRALSVAAVTNHPKLPGKNPVSAGLGPSGGTRGERFLAVSRFQELPAFPGLWSPPQVTLLSASGLTSPRGPDPPSLI